MMSGATVGECGGSGDTTRCATVGYCGVTIHVSPSAKINATSIERFVSSS